MEKKKDGNQSEKSPFLTLRHLLEAVQPIHDSMNKLRLEVVGTQSEIVNRNNEIANYQNEIVNRLIRVELKTDKLEKNMMTKEDKQDLISRIDSFAQKSEDHDNKVIFHGGRLKDLEAKSADHETRITRLETSKT